MTTSDVEEGSATAQLDRLRIDRSRRAPTRRRLVFWGVVVLLVVVAAVAVSGSLKTALLTPRVRTANVKREAATAGVVRTTASGYVVARRRASISSRLAGRLETLLVDVGDRVTEGQLLGQLGHDDLAAAVAEETARAKEREHDTTVLVQELEMARLRVKADDLRISRALSAVHAADERLEEAERVLRLEERMIKSGASSPDARDRAASDRDVAEKERLMARAGHAAAGADQKQDEQMIEVLAARLEAAKAAAEAARAAVMKAEALRADADIRAPFAGTVIRKEAEVGEMVSPVNSAGSVTRGAVVTLADFASLEMEVDVIERDIGLVTEGLPCRIVLDSRRAAPYRGTVRQVVPTADRTRGTVQVKIAFEALDAHVLPEMSGRVEFLNPGAADAALADDRVLVADAAVVKRDGSTGVFVVIDGTVSFTPIALESGTPDDRGRVRVADGLKGGEQVVLDPAPEVVDGAVVRPDSGGE